MNKLGPTVVFMYELVQMARESEALMRMKTKERQSKHLNMGQCWEFEGRNLGTLLFYTKELYLI